MVPTLKRVLAAYLASITVEPVAAEPLCRQLFSKICTDINGIFFLVLGYASILAVDISPNITTLTDPLRKKE